MVIENSTFIITLQLLDSACIGEINLLLDALSHRSRHKDIIHRSICQMAAKCEQKLRPKLYITLGKELGLISETKDILKLTQLGKLMLKNASWPPYDRFNNKQIEIITPELLGHPEIVQHVRYIIKFMKWMPKLSQFLYPRLINLNSEQNLALKLLQVTKFAKADADYITITKNEYEKLNNLLGNIMSQSEEDLWHNLTKIQIRARTAEEFVVKYEKQRLKKAKRNNLCKFVERVSATDVNAGYDIRSFESNGNLRYIEVKSSTSSHVSFYWSSIERNFAIEHQDSYWIYFIPRSHELPKLKYEITLIKNPIANEGRYLNIEPSNYKAWLTTKIKNFSSTVNGPVLTKIIE